MLWTVAVVLLVLWALGIGSSYTGGGMVHLLLVIAVIVVVFQFIAGRRSFLRPLLERSAVSEAKGYLIARMEVSP